jgi:hypothetical protein
MVCGGECEEMKRLRFFLLSACPVLLLIAVSGWWLHVQQRQYALDRQLIVALDYDDGKQALALVNAGANPNIRDMSGITALTLAQKSGRPAIIAVFRKGGR